MGNAAWCEKREERRRAADLSIRSAPRSQCGKRATVEEAVTIRCVPSVCPVLHPVATACGSEGSRFWQAEAKRRYRGP